MQYPNPMQGTYRLLISLMIWDRTLQVHTSSYKTMYMLVIFWLSLMTSRVIRSLKEVEDKWRFDHARYCIVVRALWKRPAASYHVSELPLKLMKNSKFSRYILLSINQSGTSLVSFVPFPRSFSKKPPRRSEVLFRSRLCWPRPAGTDADSSWYRSGNTCYYTHAILLLGYTCTLGLALYSAKTHFAIKQMVTSFSISSLFCNVWRGRAEGRRISYSHRH